MEIIKIKNQTDPCFKHGCPEIKNKDGALPHAPINKILIKAPNWLGDSVMSIPTVAGIRRLFPCANITVWTKKGLMDLWRLVPEVNNVIEKVAKKHNFELGILLTNSFSSAFKMFLLGVSDRRGYNVNLRRLLLTKAVLLTENCKKMHQIDYFLGIIDEKVNAVPRIDVPVELVDTAKKFLIEHGWNGDSNIIGIHATAGYGSAKCWIPDRFSQLINNYSGWKLLIGTKEEEKDIGYILERVSDRSKIINVTGKTDLKMLAGVISLCRFFIANDSGPMHLAAALGIPVVAIFGSTDPNHTGPRGKCVVVKKELDCSPCFKRVCPRNLKCMQMVSVEDVMYAIKKLTKPLQTKIELKLAIVMKDYDEQRGGAERYLAGLAQELVNNIKQVDLIVSRIKGTAPGGICVKIVKAIRWSSILEPISFNWSVKHLLKKDKYDLVYGLTQIYPQDVYRAGGGLEHSWFEIRYPKLWQRIIGYMRLRNVVRLYVENKIFKPGNYKKIITNSLLCKYQILHHYKVQPEDIVVVHNGVDKNKFNKDVKTLYRDKIRTELGIGKEDKVILFISNNWKRKGLRELIKAFSILGEGWLVVVGRGRQSAYKKFAKKYGVGDRIKFKGKTDKPEKYYGAGDVFVLPTYYDPCANVCIEALNCGMPVVTTRFNGACEFINEGKNGYIIDNVGDTKYLAGCIKKAFSLRGSIKDLTIEENAKQTIAVLNNSCDNFRSIASEIIMKESDGIICKKNKLRSVVKIDKFYLKRHFSNRKPSFALKEWQNIYRLRSIGIPTMNPVAVFEEGRESFIITESLEPAARLEDFIKTITIKEKKPLIYELAGLTKKMHRYNLFHKDFYSGHIFVKRNEDKFQLYLIDLQRLERHEFLKTRWRIKDLASLNFSSQAANITDRDRLLFLRYYLHGKLSKNRGFIKKIIRKTEKIKVHTEKMLERKNIK